MVGYDCTVYLCICTFFLILILNYQTKLDKVDVVIKKILVPYEERKEMEQLNGELQLLQKLKHPNIVKLVGFCYEYSGRQLEVPEGRNNVKFAGEGGALGIISRYASNKTMVDVNEGTHFH